MAEPFIAQIQMFGFSFAPENWATCDGQVIAITQNQALYSLIGTFFGGDGRSTFGFPELRGRAPVGFGSDNYSTGPMSYQMGARAGIPEVTLSQSQMPAHTHNLVASVDPANKTNNKAGDSQLAEGNGGPLYVAPGGTPRQTKADSVAADGGGLAHTNMQPYQAVLFCLALQGFYPSRS